MYKGQSQQIDRRVNFRRTDCNFWGGGRSGPRACRAVEKAEFGAVRAHRAVATRRLKGARRRAESEGKARDPRQGVVLACVFSIEAKCARVSRTATTCQGSRYAIKQRGGSGCARHGACLQGHGRGAPL